MKAVKISIIIIFILFILALVAIKIFHVNPPNLISNPHLSQLPLDKLHLPPGFGVEMYADSITNARSMCLSPSGILYVGTRSDGRVYAIKDLDGDLKADKVYTIMKDGHMPNGVAFKDGHLYVAEVNRILKFENIENHLQNPGEPIVIYDKYPNESHHGWKYVAFGPDGKLYVPVGAPCNICESKDPIFNSLTRINPDGSGFEIVQEGIRNTVGFTWHPTNKQLWFTDNGRDMMGDDTPECELNHAMKDGQHFGYPYIHQGDILDPEFGKKAKNMSTYTKPAAKMGPHTAPLGVTFYTGKQFPDAFHNQIFVARHGSWNRTKKSGYDILTVSIDSIGNVIQIKPFITGWLDAVKDDVWGRPVDFEILPDGSMLISDDYADCIYRVFYKG